MLRPGRQADDQRRLSAHIESIQALLREADHFAGQQDAPAVRASHVVAALDAAERRVGRVRDRLRDGIVRGVVNIATVGMEVGEINALVVVQLGPSVFGHPTRVSARVRPGRGQLVDIEREVRLGGPLHSKGVLIISSYIGARYGMARPLSFHASLVFEQSYGQVDGDSASLAETCALLSALAEVPLRQDLAVTGSIDQRGRVQAIGGVNEKVEGFFSICATRGLTGRQGVLLPADNLDNLMLHDDVVEAITAGRFHLWSIETVDDALALLTDLPTGPEGSFETRLCARLERMSAAVAPRGDEGDEG